MLGISLIANVVLFTSVLVISKKPKPKVADLSAYTQQDISKARELLPGSQTTQVKEIMGLPVVRELAGNTEEWHYCKTGKTIDEYVAISFKDQKVNRIEYYTVSWLDLAFHYVKQPTEKLIDAGGTGDCRLTTRWGTYGQKTPSYPTAPPARDRNSEPPTTIPQRR